MTATRTQHVSPSIAMLYPAYTRCCEQCGGFVATTPEETLARWTEAAYAPLAKLASALNDPRMSVTGLPLEGPSQGHPHHGRFQEHHRHHHHHDRDCGCHEREWERDDDCGCRECGRDDCHCRCCVVDADLVVNSRLGERRILPITIENNRRREREVKLELSEFRARGGAASQVAGRLLSPAEFTLGPREEGHAIVEIATGLAGAEREAAEEHPLDVDDCRVSYADLRIVGCDHRPVRIAVSLLPRDCHSYAVDCACGCC